MSVTTCARLSAFVSLLALTLLGCVQPPYNNFNKDHRVLRDVAVGAGLGAGVGAAAGSVAGNVATGALVGGAAGIAIGLGRNTKEAILNELRQQDIQIIVYGDTWTLLVPTDRYFVFNTARLNDLCYPGLENIIKLLSYYPESPIYVAGFTDDVGSYDRKKMMSQAQAETMLTFLWANRINAQRLHAEGYGDKYAIGDNQLIHGSAYNRRIEIQWSECQRVTPAEPTPYVTAMK